MMKTANLTALVFTLSLSLAAIQPTSAMALGLTDLLEAGKGHLRDLGDRLTHDDEYAKGDVVSTSEFRNDDVGRDAVHWANGGLSLVADDDDDEYYIQLNSDFRTGPAPDLYIYIAGSKVVDEASFWAAKPLEISKLESGSGAQFYELPEHIDVSEHVEVIIWCKRFGAFIGAATL